MQHQTDLFAHKSKQWDTNSKRVQNTQAIAELIVKKIHLTKDMKLMDLGAGTGLLSYCISPLVGTIIAVDNSPSMLKEFESKCNDFECKTEVREIDFSQDTLDEAFDGIISSMTIHHIEDTPALFTKLYHSLGDHGFIAIADLESEDGTFHDDNTGVFHFGFEREKLTTVAQSAGFKEICFSHVSTIAKPHRIFDIFLMTAIK